MTYNLKLINCGNRLEIYRINDYFIRTGKEEKKEIKDKKEKKERQKQSHKDKVRNLRESRNKIMRLIKCNPDMSTFITLTFREVPTIEDSKTMLTKFFRKLKRDYKCICNYKGLKYIYVMEFGSKNHRLHYHILCNMPVNIQLNRNRKSDSHKEYEQRFSEKYWEYGFVDIRSLSQEHNTNIALYVSTYIVKSLENTELDGINVFNYSRNLNKPIVTKVWTKQDTVEILKEFKDYKITYTNSYQIGEEGTVNYFDLIKEEE